MQAFCPLLIGLFLSGFVNYADSIDRSRISTLHCYQCITLSCFEKSSKIDPDHCQAITDFLNHELSRYYYTQPGKEYPRCPKPTGAGDQWEALQSAPACQGHQGQATCALGRFQVTTWNAEFNTNATVYGTVLGCAKVELIDKISKDLIKKTSLGCLYEKTQSFIGSSIYYLDLEHCSKASDLCCNYNFCVTPKSSVIKQFLSADDGGGGRYTLTIVICILVALGIVIALLTFLGIKYNA